MSGLLLASVRRGFSSNVLFGPESWCADAQMSGDKPLPGSAYEWQPYLSSAWGPVEAARHSRALQAERWGGVKRALILVHGYNSDVRKSRRAFHEIQAEISGCYDRVIGFLWPGSNAVFGYWTAWLRARKAGEKLADLIRRLRSVGVERIDLNGHSMGCAVILKALMEERAGVVVLNGPAVDRDALAPGGEFFPALPNIWSCIIAWSRTDPALGIGGVLARWRKEPMGAMGPLFSGSLPDNVLSLDLTGEVLSHGAYRKHPDIYAAWKRLLE